MGAAKGSRRTETQVVGQQFTVPLTMIGRTYCSVGRIRYRRTVRARGAWADLKPRRTPERGGEPHGAVLSGASERPHRAPRLPGLSREPPIACRRIARPVPGVDRKPVASPECRKPG